MLHGQPPSHELATVAGDEVFGPLHINKIEYPANLKRLSEKIQKKNKDCTDYTLNSTFGERAKFTVNLEKESNWL